MSFDIDLDAFSEHLAGLVRKSLEGAGITTENGGRTLDVEVVYLDFMFKGPCYLDYTVTLGSGERFGLQASGASTNFGWACRDAMEAAVLQLLNDARTRRYLEGG